MRTTTPIRLLISTAILASGCFVIFQSGGSTNIALISAIVGLFAIGVVILPGADDPVVIAVRKAPILAVELSVIEAIGDPVLLVENGRIAAANRGAKSLFGDHIDQEDVRLALRHPEAIERLANSDDADITEIVGLGGRDMHWEMHVATLEGGRRLIHLIDRSFRYAAERARVDFVANASHELRTPLAAIMGFVETLQTDAAGGDKATRARFLSVIASEASRMQRLTDDLMSLSRIESGKFEAPTETLSLESVVTQALDEIRDENGHRPARLETDFSEAAPLIKGDRNQLLQLVHNLVTNALKYGRADTPVRIAVTSSGDKTLILSLQDEGDGIAAEHLPRLTERFYRIDQARSQAGGGTGLGLAIVKHIVERHRGQLDIQSRIGEGTRISVSFPVPEAPLSQ